MKKDGLRLTREACVQNWGEKPCPDCCTCVHRSECERFAEGSYCTRWASREPEERKPDPNEQWMTGEDASF